MRRLIGLRLVVIGLIWSGSTRAASAQEVFGTLRRADLDAPAQGTIVVAERLSDGRAIARAVTGAQGNWHLRLTTERLVIRALRIGFTPHVLDTIQLAVGERRELNAVLPGTAVVLTTVRTAADTRCRVRPDSASLVARLFHEARTALAASLLIAPDGPVRSHVRVTQEVWSTDESEMLEDEHREFVSDSLRPFRTAPVDTLIEAGVVVRKRDAFPTLRNERPVAVDYRVPGVDLLVDDRFLEHYCLQLSDARTDHPDWIGVAFRPARARRITQIDGTLWIDRHSAELRRMDFGYTGLDGAELKIGPGGRLEFTRLETGTWFVSRWSLRVPAIGSWVEQSARATTLIVLREIPVVRVHGEVLELTVDSRVVFTVGATDLLRGGALVPIPMLTDSASAACATAGARVHAIGSVLTASGAAVANAELRFVWRANGGPSAGWLQSDARTRSTGAYLACGLPADQPISVEIRADGFEPAGTTLRVGSPRSAARLDIVLVRAR